MSGNRDRQPPTQYHNDSEDTEKMIGQLFVGEETKIYLVEMYFSFYPGVQSAAASSIMDLVPDTYFHPK